MDVWRVAGTNLPKTRREVMVVVVVEVLWVK
jgi:hypothetical protein